MSFYPQMAATAAAMLAEFGQAVMFERREAGSYDPASGAAAEGTVSRWSLATVEEAFGGREIDGTLVMAGDRRLLVAAGGVAPAVEDVVTLADGSAGVVKAVAPFSPGGVSLYFEVRVR